MSPAWQMPDDDTKAQSGRVTDLLQVITLECPHVLRNAERALRQLLTEHRRQTISERLERLDARGLDEITAVLAIIERTHRDEPTADR